MDSNNQLNEKELLELLSKSDENESDYSSDTNSSSKSNEFDFLNKSQDCIW